MPQIRECYDVCVVGAGHAGCEAALACAKMGLETVIFTVSVDSIALMPCNPNIGGSSKGHLVREVDALGGEMGKNIDKTFIQSKMLNVSKGPAVHSLRAQADKAEYTWQMRMILENQEHLTIKQAEVCELLAEDLPDTDDGSGKCRKKITGVRIYTGAVYEASGPVFVEIPWELIRAEENLQVEVMAGKNGQEARYRLAFSCTGENPDSP